MTNLTHLNISSTKLQSLKGISSNLTQAVFSHCNKLSDIASLSECQKLHSLEFYSCKKILDISSLAQIRQLQTLLVIDCGKIQSLAPLQHCQALETLNFAGNTTIEDGQLGVIKSLSNLKSCWFADRKHYSDKRDNIGMLNDN